MKRAAQLAGAALYMLLLSTEPHAFATSPEFTTTIFVCALEIAPDDCDSATATDVTRGPPVSSEVMCGRNPQAMMAATALAPHAGVEYIKIRCERRG